MQCNSRSSSLDKLLQTEAKKQLFNAINKSVFIKISSKNKRNGDVVYTLKLHPWLAYNIIYKKSTGIAEVSPLCVFSMIKFPMENFILNTKKHSNGSVSVKNHKNKQGRKMGVA